MQQACFEQFTHQNRYATCRLEVVNISRTVRVETCHQRYNIRKVREVIPVNLNTGRACHRHQVHGVVSGTTGRQQCNDTVHHHFLIYHLTDRHPFITITGHACNLARSGCGQSIAQRRIRMNKRRAWQLHPHKLHHHLVGVGSTVESTCSRRMIRRGF